MPVGLLSPLFPCSLLLWCLSLSRRHSTLLARLRLNFSGLNDDLRRIGKHPTGACECGALENRRHFILDCRLLARPRAQLVREIGKHSLPPLTTQRRAALLVQ